MIILPKDGCIKDDRVLEGDRYAEYSYLLDELPKLPVLESTETPQTVVAYHTPEAEEDVALVQKLQSRQVTGKASSLDDALDFAEESSPVRNRKRPPARKKKEFSV